MTALTAIVPSPLGGLLLSASADALVEIGWTDAPPTGAFPSPLLEETARQLAAYFADPKAAFTLPLAPAGDAFEQAVWREMCAIPPGLTATYGDLGQATGRPARAVGGACGRNPIPIVIPCHRVVGADGRMVGYSGRGGVETKRWLLQHEGALLI
ncbi:MAG: methylated-DNA--[protein]-cysteine S-methyltransferase [Alphaproteobacteria bacterium]